MLVTAPDMKLSPEYLYIGDPDTILEFLKQGPDIRPGTFLISAGSICPFPGFLPECLTIIETSQALLPLYNRLHEHLHRFRIWDEELHHIVYTNGGLQALLEHAYQELHATILLLNSGYNTLRRSTTRISAIPLLTSFGKMATSPTTRFRPSIMNLPLNGEKIGSLPSTSPPSAATTPLCG